MLLQLNIKNFALIQDLSVEFGKGFNILSGETGRKINFNRYHRLCFRWKVFKGINKIWENKTFVEAIFTIENEDILPLLKS